MEVDDIVTAVEAIIQDTTYDETWIIQKFNEAMMLISLTCRIPGWQMSAVVTAEIGATSIILPKTYLRELYLVTTETYPQGILIAPNLKDLATNTDPDQEGPVEVVALDGKTLNFRPKPLVAEDLTLFFYGAPKELAAGDSFPDYIPPILHKEIFQNYALKEAYLQIEDGIDGVMTNTNKYAGLAGTAIAALAAFYPNASKARAILRRGGGHF